MSNEGLITDALFRTAPDLYLSIDGGNSFKAALAKRGARTSKYRRYVSGDHDATLTTQMRKMLRLTDDTAGLNALNINYMGIIVDKMAGRLNVSKIMNEPKKAGIIEKIGGILNPNKVDPAQQWIDNLLLDVDFEAIQGMMWRGAIRDGDSYVMVDPKTSKWTVEPGYDGFSGMFALLEQGKDYPVWACKLYSYADLDLSEKEPATTVGMKIVVYQPNKITYFTGQSGGSEVTLDKDIDKETLKRADSWKLGVIPIIHYANLKDSFTQFGESEIRKGIAPQDVLNRTLHSMVMASEFSAFRVSWCIGMEIDKNGIAPGDVLNLVLTGADGKPITSMTPEQVEYMKAVRVGEFEATDISQYTNQIEKITIQISHVTSTPIYGITTTGNVSGEALKQLETGLIGKCKRFQKENTGAIRALIELTAKVQSTFEGFKDPPELGRLTVEWDSPELRDNVIDKEYQEKSLAWKAASEVVAASNGMIPFESVLRSFTNLFTDEEMSSFGTQKMAAIQLEQEDAIPDEGL
jgi:hypothetical protein